MAEQVFGFFFSQPRGLGPWRVSFKGSAKPWPFGAAAGRAVGSRPGQCCSALWSGPAVGAQALLCRAAGVPGSPSPLAMAAPVLEGWDWGVSREQLSWFPAAQTTPPCL